MFSSSSDGSGGVICWSPGASSGVALLPDGGDGVPPSDGLGWRIDCGASELVPAEPMSSAAISLDAVAVGPGDPPMSLPLLPGVLLCRRGDGD
jgi:hypothetical protein